ncbi:MAG: hypothetical protein ACRD1D_16295, partial [Acidimicrobiales bacterium]
GPSALSGHSPPKVRTNPANDVTVTGSSTGPRAARPTKAVMEVATGGIVDVQARAVYVRPP